MEKPQLDTTSDPNLTGILLWELFGFKNTNYKNQIIKKKDEMSITTHILNFVS